MKVVQALLLAVLVGFGVHDSQAQITMGFLELHSQPRIHALGEATVAMRGYQGAMDINPATVGDDETAQIGGNVGTGAGPFFANEWASDSFFLQNAWISTASTSVKRGPWGGALQLKNYSTGPIQVRDERGVSQGTFEIQEWALTAAGAYDVTDAFTVGAGLKLLRSKTAPDESETTAALDLGLHYRRSYATEVVQLRPALGWSLSNFGPKVDYGADVEQALPMTMRLGTGVDLASTQTWRRRPVFQLGVYGALSKRLYNVRGDRFDWTVDGPFRTLFSTGWTPVRGAVGPNGQYDRVSVWEQTVRHAGVDLRLFDILSLQWGRFYEAEAAGGDQYTGYGFGIDLYYLELEHSWAETEEEFRDNSFWRVTAQIPLQWDDSRNFWQPLLE